MLSLRLDRGGDAALVFGNMDQYGCGVDMRMNVCVCVCVCVFAWMRIGTQTYADEK